MGVDSYPIIGILVPNKIRRKRALELHHRHCNLPLKLYAFTPTDILWRKRKIVGLCLIGHKLEERIFPFPHAVYNQCYNKKATVIEHINSIIGKDKCFNSINWFNKWDVYNLLTHSNVITYLPETFMLHDVDVLEFLKYYKLAYIKPCYGFQGNGVYRIELKENGDIHISLDSIAPRFICRKNEDIEHLLVKVLGDRKFIVQRGVRSSLLKHKYYDIRVLVQKDGRGEWMVSSMVCRVANELLFNTTAYGSIWNVEEVYAQLYANKIVKEIAIRSIRRISVSAAEALEPYMGLLGELSVDFLLDQNKRAWIIELNGKPQKSIYKDVENFQCEELMYRRPLEYAYYLSQ